ncbi:hypothetical protein HA402_010568 [Bradysia odoriphaga]|nr:hypothetical protein HA402_010568 [Bradysia odoriphaga]
MMLNFNLLKNSLSFFVLVVMVNCHNGYDHDVAKYFSEHKVVPDVIAIPPRIGLKVTYNDKEVNFGNELTPTEVKDIPLVDWTADAHSFYTLIMTDPDAPSRKEPTFGQWFHWTVVNIPGNDLSKGDTLVEYVGSGPPPDTDLHRYVLLVFKQQHKHDFNEPILSNKSGEGRAKRSVKDFVTKHELGDAIAGNFFQAKYDDYVPTLYKQLGL